MLEGSSAAATVAPPPSSVFTTAELASKLPFFKPGVGIVSSSIAMVSVSGNEASVGGAGFSGSIFQGH